MIELPEQIDIELREYHVEFDIELNDENIITLDIEVCLNQYEEPEYWIKDIETYGLSVTNKKDLKAEIYERLNLIF